MLGELTLAERIVVVEELWDSIAAEQASVPVTPAQQAELDARRLEAYRENPTAGYLGKKSGAIWGEAMNRKVIIRPEAEADLAEAYG